MKRGQFFGIPNLIQGFKTMAQHFFIRGLNGRKIDVEFTKKGVFHWNGIKFIAHHPIVQLDEDTIGQNPFIWTVSVYKQGCNIIKKEYPTRIFKNIKSAKEAAITVLNNRGIKAINKQLNQYPIINIPDVKMPPKHE